MPRVDGVYQRFAAGGNHTQAAVMPMVIRLVKVFFLFIQETSQLCLRSARQLVHIVKHQGRADALAIGHS